MAANLPPRFAYLRLADELRQRAAALEPYSRLPSIEILCQEFGMSPKTVRKATRLLEQEGVLCVKPNMGTFVSQRP